MLVQKHLWFSGRLDSSLLLLGTGIEDWIDLECQAASRNEVMASTMGQ